MTLTRILAAVTWAHDVIESLDPDAKQLAVCAELQTIELELAHADLLPATARILLDAQRRAEAIDDPAAALVIGRALDCLGPRPD